MEASALGHEQQLLLDQWLGHWTVRADHSWGLTDMTVLEVDSDRGMVIVKAAGPQNVHIRREVRAHQQWTGPWLRTGKASRLVASDTDAGILVTSYLPGRLVEGSSAQDDPDCFRQAGKLLSDLHSQYATQDDTWGARLLARVQRFLSQDHRMARDVVQRVEAEISSWPTGGATVVPTHGDWAPRNWLVDDAGTILPIDLGRCDLRAPEEDFVRLARQDFHRDPALEVAFLDGYGQDPRDPDTWRRVNVAEAVGTAVWAHQVGDEDFEALGHAHLARLYPD